MLNENNLTNNLNFILLQCKKKKKVTSVNYTCFFKFCQLFPSAITVHVLSISIRMETSYNNQTPIWNPQAIVLEMPNLRSSLSILFLDKLR